MELAGRHVIVTGADGFIGSHLVEALVREGCAVRALCFYNSFGSRGWMDSVSEEITREVEFTLGDVRDAPFMRQALGGTEVVFHLAALVGIPFSYHAPDSYVATNVNGTLNVLQAAREADLDRVVVTSTSEVYGTARHVPIDEEHPLQGQSPYSASKIAADKLAESFHLSFGLPVVIVRPFNTYGPRQSARAVIPTIIGQLLSGADRVELGAVHPTRDLTFVEDTCAGFVSLASCDDAVGREVNLGVGREISIGELAETLKRVIGSSAEIVSVEERMRPAGSEVERLLSDNTLVRELTGWEPTVTLEDGLGRTIDWFRQHGDSLDGRRGYAT